MDGSIRVDMFGLRVPAGKAVAVGSDESETTITTVQITQVALGDNAEGKHVVYMADGKNKWVIGTLRSGKCEQFQTDYMGRQKVLLTHTGSGDVYVSGFKTVTMLDDESDEEEGEEGSEEEEEEDSEDEQPTAALLGNGKPAGVKQLVAAAGQQGESDEDEEGEEDEDDDDEDDDDEDLEGLEGEEFSDMSDGGDEDEDEDEDEEDEEEEEEAPPQKKRPAPAAAAAQPAKKAKEAGGDVAAYEKALRDFLKKEGPTNLATLGSKVQGRPGNIKMKKFLDERPNLFKIDPKGLVSLAK